MTNKKFTKPWHGIPREEIPWFPTLNEEKCIGCELCYLSCGRNVFEVAAQKPRKAKVANPLNCMVGCSTCATVCPTEAISFPGREIIWKLERQHKIFKIVHEEAAAKKEKLKLTELKEAAEEQISETVTRKHFEIAGQFGEKRFLKKLSDLIENEKADIVDLQLKVPTLKGMKENAPGFMRFTLTSTKMEEIKTQAGKIRELIKENNMVLVNET